MLRFEPSRSTDALLQRAQQLALGRERHAVDLVEKQRAAACVFELAEPRLHRAGEGAGLVAEELALHHRLRNSRAIDRDVVALGAAAEIVQAARDQILADAGLAIDDDADIGAGKFGDGRAQRLGGARRADDARGQRLLVDRAPQPAVLDHELALLAGAADNIEKRSGANGFSMKS